MASPTLTRKQREIQEREDRILRAARDILLERGYLGLTMDRIATAIEYSKGTVYHHFSSKEDIVVALAAKANDTRSDFFERAVALEGRSRERALAVGVSIDLFARLHPSWLRAEQVIHASSVSAKADRDRVRALYSHESRCFQSVMGVTLDGIESGDLPAGTDPVFLVFGLWGMTYGAHFLQSSDMPLDDKGIADAGAALRANQHALLDGYGWRPLSHEWDYEGSEKRILKEVFPVEATQLGLLSGS